MISLSSCSDFPTLSNVIAMIFGLILTHDDEDRIESDEEEIDGNYALAITKYFIVNFCSAALTG
jgi:hypothetical protein